MNFNRSLAGRASSALWVSLLCRERKLKAAILGKQGRFLGGRPPKMVPTAALKNSLFFAFGVRVSFVAQDGLKLMILLPRPPEYWDGGPGPAPWQWLFYVAVWRPYFRNTEDRELRHMTRFSLDYRESLFSDHALTL